MWCLAWCVLLASQAAPAFARPSGLYNETVQEQARRLQEEILLSAGWEFPLGTKLAFDSQLEASAFGSGAAAALSLTLLAGYRYSLVAISVPEDFKFGIDHNQAVVSLVVSSITRDSCARSAYAVSMALVRASLQTDSFVPSTLADGQLLRLRELLSDGTMIGQTATFPHVSFMHGGDYQLCYSPDGSMAGNEFLNNIVPVSIRVIGVSSSCIGNGCLANERWDCFISYRLESASRCLIDFRSFGGGRDGWQVEAGTYSKTAWSAAWVQDTYLAGEFVPAPRKRCSDVSTLEYIQPEVDIFETFSWAPPTGLGFITDTVTAMDMPALKPSSATGSYSLTACYCPNYDGPQDPTVEPCDHASEYIQPIGVIYYWLLRICDAGNTASCGPQAAAPFMRVLPQQPFSLRLQCPPGGDACTGSAENRVKFLPGFCPLCSLGESSEQIPIWDIGSRCRSGDAETSHMIFHPSVDEDGNPLDEAAYRSGGTNRDYKFWETPNLIGKLPMSERVVVCYCDVACHNFQNFFEVGEIRMADSAGVARWSKPGSQFQLIQPIETVEYPGKPGGITLFAGIRSNISEGMHPYDSIPWRRKSIMKILSFDSAAEYTAASSGAKVTLEEYLNLNREDTALGRRGLDTACAVNATSAGTVNGPATEDVSAQFAAWVGPEASQYLPFTGIENDQTFEFYLAGTYVVCYCSFLTTAGICDDTGYIWAATILLKGSRTNQQVLLPTNFVVRIDLEGWGFTSQDTLRLITQTQTCSENANNPKGVVDGFRLGCPGVDGLTCRKPVVEEDVSVMLISAEATGFYIESVIMEQTRTILVFNGAVTSEVLDGDQITLDESSILLNGRGQLSWTDYERHIVSKFSGWPAFADEPESQRMLWNRVSHTDAPNQLSIPLGWAEADRPELTFLNNKGLWHRRNRLQTQEEIKADAAASLKICWGARDGGNQEYYGEAGVLTFASPAPMAAAGLYFTSLAGGSEAPAVISFTPTRGKVDYRRQTSIVLRILFKEMPRSITPLTTSRVEMGDNETVASEDMSQAVCGSLFLEMWTNDVSGFPLPKGCYYGPLYTDFKDPNGQEQPSYREYFIEFEPRHSLRDRCTDELSGRAASCVYQLVLNMRIQEAEFQLGKEIMSLYTLCAGRSGYATVCGPRYGVIEYGQVFPILPVRAPALNAPRRGRVEVLPFEAAQRVGSRGLGQDLEDLMLEASEVLEDGSDGLSLGLRAWAKEAAYPIQAGARLQLIFRPLTLWSLSPVVSRNCNASCLAAPGLTCDDVRGPGMVGCQLKALVDTATVRDVPMQQNILEMQLPNLMDEMPEHRADEAHLLKLLHLKLPREGFFKTCMLATYSEDGMPPSVVEVEPCMKKAPAPGVTTGQILVDGQAGNGPKPFAFERDNEIIVRLTLGATLRNMLLVEAELPNETGTELVPGQAAQVQVLLPEGYSCTVVGNGTADPLGEKSFFKQDLNNDGFVDNPASTVFSGQWSWDGSMCKYSLESTAALFANQFIDVRLSVQNPLRPLLKTDERNRWHIQLITSEGDVLGPPAQFMSLEEEVPGWVGNLAVLGTLEGESLQPSNFTNHAENTLRVFFQMTRNMPEHSLILLDAPPGYDFTLSCQVHELEPAYYQDWEALPWAQGLTGAQGPTGAFGTDVNCSADDWQRPADIPTATAPFTRAILRIGRTLLLGKYYGFAILVQNPGEWNLTQHDEWRLWLQSPEGYMVDGSRYSVQFNAARVDSLPVEPHDRGWAVYPSSAKLPLYFDFGTPRLLPTAAFATSAFLTVYALTPSTNGVLSSLRVIAPLGYVWMPDAEEGWLGYVPNVTCKYCELIVSPVVRFQNELILPDLVMRINQAFGFRVRVYVPMRPPTRSTNAFFLEIGFDPGTEGRERMQAAMIEAPKIRVVHDVFIESRCNLAGFKENVMDFSLRIASPLEVNEGFLFAGDELTRGTVLRCWPSELPFAPLSVTAAQGSCLVFEHPTTLLPLVKIWLSSGTSPAGHYGFRFRSVQSPSHPAPRRAFWRLGTFRDLHLYPKHQILDVAVDTPSPRLLGFLPEAGILRPGAYLGPFFGRDDAPGRVNTFGFYFRVGEPPIYPVSDETFVLALRGPLGFVFLEDCSQGLRAFTEAMVGEDRFPCSTDTLELWCPQQLQPWPDLLAPSACLGIANTARIDVPNSVFLAESRGADGLYRFQQNGLYGFEIQVTNPDVTPLDNFWALDFGLEASRPFLSIRIQTFVPEEFRLELGSAVANQFWWPRTQVYLPFRLDFMPDTTIPAPRMLEQRRLQSGGSEPLLPEAEDGSLVLFAPFNFEFPKLDFDLCASASLERLGRVPWDSEGLFAMGTDATCRVGDALGVPAAEGGSAQQVSLVFWLIHRKALLQGQAYTVQSLVRNPQQADWPSSLPWRLESYQRFIATGQKVRLDSSVLAGQSITPPADTFQITNSAAEHTTSAKVYGVQFTLQLPHPLLTGDSIEVTAPPGFELRANGSNTSNASRCLDFRWQDTWRPLRLDVEPYCDCSSSVDFGHVCSLIVNVSFLSPEDVLGADTPVGFEMSVWNPAGPNAPVRNWWGMRHWRSDGRLLSSAFAEGWPILGTLQNMSAFISGYRQRAGSQSDITLLFTPTLWASAVDLVFHEPPGFDFSTVRPSSPLIRHAFTQGSRVVLANGDFRPNLPGEVFLGEVMLGSGGPTRISMQLFADARMEQEVARRLNFFQGFVQPGALQIDSQQLLSEDVTEHYEGDAYDSVLPLLPCFAKQRARIEIFFQLSQYAMAGEIFVLKNLSPQPERLHELVSEEGYEPLLEFCAGADGGREENTTLWQCDRVLPVNHSAIVFSRNNFDILDGFSTRLLPKADVYVTDQAAKDQIAWITDGSGALAMEANRNYRLRLWILPTSIATQWSISTGHMEPTYLTNTNDAETFAPTAVAEMFLSVTTAVSRRPPLAAVYVTVTINAAPIEVAFSRLVILPPYGFAPLGVTPPANARAILELPLGQDFAEMSYQLRMIMPRRTNLDPRWFVLARKESVDEITGEVMDRVVGWGSAPGFDIAPCPAFARYGALPSYTGWLALTFKTPSVVMGRFALFTAPPEFRAQCPPGQGMQPCEAFKPAAGMPIEILALPVLQTLNITMAAGNAEGEDQVYTMMLTITTPAILTSLQSWELRVLDQVFTVVDSSLDIPSTPLAELQAENPSLTWLTVPQRGEAATVQIQVVINRRVRFLRMLVFLMPEGYRHDIQHRNQLANINKNFPVAIERDWRDFENLRYVRIYVEPTTVSSGNFQWRFPVILPINPPINSEWYVHLCSEYTCRVFSDPSVITSFPVPDFQEKIPAKTFGDFVLTAGAPIATLWAPFLGLVFICTTW